MAQRAEPLNPDPNVNDLSRINSERDVVIVAESLQIVTAESSSLNRESPFHRAGDSVASGIAKVRFFGERLSHQFKRMRADEPLKLVAIGAGTAFVLGALTRIWRSNHD